MATIATCPGCTAQLAIPDSATSDSRAQCPECAAEFALHETIQLALPKAQILPAIETPAATDPARDADVASPAAPPAADAPLASWETRLKNAVDSDFAAPTKPETGHAIDASKELEESELAGSVPDQTPAYETPTFDFGDQLDPPASAEPSSDPTTAGRETGSLDPALDTPETASAIHVSQPLEEPSKTPIIPSAAQRPRRRRWSRVAAAVLGGPVLGILLGCYGLLWIKGPSADYLRLTKILPAALLPQWPTEAPIQQDPVDPLPDQSDLVEATPDGTPISVAPNRDERVQPATALEPRTPRTLPDGITAEAFSQLVADAEAALPRFVQGRLTDSASLNRKGQAYMTLCRLAEQFGFANELGLSPQAHRQIRLGQQVFREATAEAGALADLTRIASRWWAYQERSSDGIFFVGRVRQVEAVGSRSLVHLALVGSADVEISVLFNQLPFSEGEMIGVVGRISNGSSSPNASGLALPHQTVIPHYYYALSAAPTR